MIIFAAANWGCITAMSAANRVWTGTVLQVRLQTQIKSSLKQVQNQLDGLTYVLLRTRVRCGSLRVQPCLTSQHNHLAYQSPFPFSRCEPSDLLILVSCRLVYDCLPSRTDCVQFGPILLPCIMTGISQFLYSTGFSESATASSQPVLGVD